jgi:hypothetical protein
MEEVLIGLIRRRAELAVVASRLHFNIFFSHLFLLYFIMEMLIILGFVSFATLAVFSLVDILRQINRIDDEEN